MLIAFKSQLTGSAVIRVPLQDVKIHLIQIHFSYLKLVDKTVYQLNVTRAGLYALSLANVIPKLVTVYSLENCFLYFVTKHLKIHAKVFNFRELLHTKSLNSSCSILREWGKTIFLNSRHLLNILAHLSVLLWCCVDDKLTLALYGFGVGFWKARRVWEGGTRELPSLTWAQSKRKVSGLFPLRFLLPSLPRGAAEPAIVQEEPGAQGANHRALGTDGCGWLIIRPLAWRSPGGSPGRVAAELPAAAEREAALGEHRGRAECECTAPGGGRRAGGEPSGCAAARGARGEWSHREPERRPRASGSAACRPSGWPGRQGSLHSLAQVWVQLLQTPEVRPAAVRGPRFLTVRCKTYLETADTLTKSFTKIHLLSIGFFSF